MKKTLETITNTQYYFSLLLIFFSLGIGALPSAAAFYILEELGGGVQTASYGVSLFILGAITTKPLALILGNKIGKILLMRICLISTLIFSLPIFFIKDYNFYLTFRFLTGFASGPLFLIANSLGGGMRPKEKLDKFIFILVLLMLIVPIFSASFGGFMAYQYSWKVAFFIFNFLLVPLIYLSFTLFKKQEAPTIKEPFDVIGFVTFFIGLTSLGFCLVFGQTIDGFRSNAFNIVFTVGCLSTLFFIGWNMWQPYPILKFHILKDKKLLFNLINTLALFLFFYAIIVMLSFWLHLYVNYSINWIAFSLFGVLIGPLFLYIAFYSRNKSKSLILLSISLCMLSIISFYISSFNSEVNFGRILITKLVAGISLALALPPIIYSIKNSVDLKDFPPAFCLFAMFRMLGSFIGVAYFITLWERRAIFYNERLGGELTPFSENTRQVLDKLNYFQFSPQMKLQGLQDALNRQSQSLALDDCYFIMAWIMLALSIISLINLQVGKKTVFEARS
ncbi:MAG: Fatty acid resistance protein FarB [Chlamydiae bacterium]|nr:Fatty acid resistance protein FarB [Chlamydiota bacterium]